MKGIYPQKNIYNSTRTFRFDSRRVVYRVAGPGGPDPTFDPKFLS